MRAGNQAYWLAPTRVKEHLKELTRVAGDFAPALVELGRAHADGVFATTDYKLARTCFEKAAAQGNAEAKFLLAKMRLRGWGEKASPEAITEIRAMADQGMGEAAYYIGHLYYWGTKEAPGIVKDPAVAFKYIRLAAEKGHPQAVVNLALCYEHGIGTPVNYPLAAKVYWAAWELGYIEGRNRVRKLMGFVKID
ncbi:MAG: tetratricopeptide repeat protein [Verrucomicrobiota bacterium]